ncbi:RNA polymerase recycling motor HelD [Ectobacillus sp. sgz5001026]|uniref:RNA polymerase recycling motor HelD n=1 Tax=Ectobacillus sp. sgz5001026 TaxID=3242473 RepID=UPI0036D21883
MDNQSEEYKWEQRRVDEVVEKAAAKASFLQQYVGTIKSTIVGMRKNFWEDVTVNFEDATEAAETHASLKQQAELLSERERSYTHSQNEVKTLQRLQYSPYFGRIDFKEDGEKQADSIYLGIGSFYDEKTEQFLVYDWRAPISSLYYDYTVGPATYKAPVGMVSGEMTVKRQFLIRSGIIESVFDSSVTIGDTLLQEVLGKQANTAMKSIVATIQREQNAIIRNETSRMLIVQGVAGSGKTSAALQRIAYLLYRYRESLLAEQILLFSPNPIFGSFVSTVLPELGEDNMQQTTFQNYIEHQLGKDILLEDSFTQMEYVLSAYADNKYEARISSIKYKASQEYMKVLDSYVIFLKEQGMLFLDVEFRGEQIVSAKQIEIYFYSLDRALSLANRVRLTTEWLIQLLKTEEKKERKKPWVEEEMELADQHLLTLVHQKLQRERRYTEDTFDDFEREQRLLAAMIVREHMKPTYRFVKQLQFLHIYAVYQNLFSNSMFALQFVSEQELPSEWQEICKVSSGLLKNSSIPYEDATAYLYVKEQLEGVQKNTSIRHVFIDEAQDYSPFQFIFLKRLFPFAKMTVLGDYNQSIHVQSENVNLFHLTSLYGEKATERIELTRSYRSTKQIIEFSRMLLPSGQHIQPFQREGKKPVVIKVTDEDRVSQIVTCVKSLQHHTIAIICKTAKESKLAYELLQPGIDVRLITKETASYDHGVLIIPSYLAKGIEFDAVIIYDASKTQYGRENERKLFYTACTRAMHELYLFYTNEVSPFLHEVTQELFERDGLEEYEIE